jgi:nucleotide-binding universal stress UspA family protein
VFTTILVPTDGSAVSRLAEDAAIEFARRNGATMVVLSVAEPSGAPAAAASRATAAPFPVETALAAEDLLDAAQRRVQELVDRAQSAEIPCQCSIALSYHPYEEILKAAADFQCDVIFMASQGHGGAGKVVLGSEAQKVLAHARLPVIVFR